MTGRPYLGQERALDGEQIVTAAVLIIGDEILSGRTKDRNSGAIAEHLTNIGIRLKEIRVVPDDEAEICAAVNALKGRYDYLFTTGGIGPTHDDITADSVAKAFGVAIDIDPRAEKLLAENYSRRGLALTPARLRMARIPAGASLIVNPLSGAPGFRIANIIVMAGVPGIMRAMLEAITPDLKTGDKVLSLTIAVDRPESEIADIFSAHQQRYRDVAMGSYPRLRDGKPVADLVLRSVNADRLSEAAVTLKAALGL
jgi:molybdenum cofactor synthesis domain-containing protein